MKRVIYTTDVFDKWFSSLKDRRAVVRIQARIDRVEDGNLGDVKPVGSGVSEMRIHYGAGYRIYYMQRGVEIIVLLAGGDKASQSSDIRRAIEIAKKIRNNENE